MGSSLFGKAGSAKSEQEGGPQPEQNAGPDQKPCGEHHGIGQVAAQCLAPGAGSMLLHAVDLLLI